MHLIKHKVSGNTRAISDEQLEAMKATPFIMNQYTVMAKPEEPEEVIALKNKKKIKPQNPENPDNGGQDGKQQLN